MAPRVGAPSAHRGGSGLVEPVAYVLALASAGMYGSADFLGGLASRRAPLARVVFLSQLTGLVLVALAIPLVGSGHPSFQDLAWGAAAGVSGAVGLALLYRGLAIGPMAVVAPVTATCAAAVPVVTGLSLGERPGLLPLLGVSLAIGAIGLLGATTGGREATGSDAKGPGSRSSGGTGRPAFVVALGAGVAIGGFYICLSRTSSTSGMWPLLSDRVAAVGLLAAVPGSWRELRPAAPGTATAIIAGGIDMLANVFYLLAIRRGLLAVVPVLSSLYPASTVFLSRLFLGERVRRVQALGLAVALGAVALIAMRSP